MIADRWGVTPAETTRPYPCDAFAPDPVLQAWRGVTVRTTPERVWPWLVQIRLAPYSYDLVDNLGRHSPRELRSLPTPVVGDPFTATAGRAQGEVLAVDEGRALTGRILGAVMSYVLEPGPDANTRLLQKIVMQRGRVLAPLVAVGDLVMARKQLLTLQGLAEGELH